MSDEELIARLLMPGEVDDETCIAAADRIEALVKERDAALASNRGLVRLNEATEARAERLEAALRVARVHVANNAEGWSVSRGAARNDLTIVDAALKGADHE